MTSFFPLLNKQQFAQSHDEPMLCPDDDDFEVSICDLTHNSLPLDCLMDPTLQDDTAIVKGGPSGPNAQNATLASVHTSIISERTNSVNNFPSTSNDRTHMQDVPIRQPAYYEQWIRTRSISIKNSDTTQYYTFRVLGDVLNGRYDTDSSNFSAHNPAFNVLNSAAFVSWDSLDVYASVSAPPNVSGLGILTAMPPALYPADVRFGNGSDLFKSQLEICSVRAFNMPHVKISYTESNSAILNVPWSFPFASISTTSNLLVPESVLKIAYYNFVKPDCGVDSDSEVTLTFFVRFNDLRGEGKRPMNMPMTLDPTYSYGSFQDDEKPFIQYVHAFTNLCNKEDFSVSYDYESNGPPHLRTWRVIATVRSNGNVVKYQTPYCFSKQEAKQEVIKTIVTESGELQDLTSILEQGENIVSKVSDLTNPSNLTSTAGSALSGIGKILGDTILDAPWAPPSAESRVVPVSVDNFPGGVGPRKVVVMDIDDSHHESPLEGISYADADLKDALFRPGFLFAVDVPVSTRPGVLFHLPCTVIDGCASFNGVDNLSGGTFYPTPASMIASNYQYVQGTKLYEIFVVKSDMQTVTLNVSFNPTFPPKNLGLAMAGRSETWTVQEDVSKIIEAPIISPWRKFPFNVPRSMLKSETGEPISGFGYLTFSLVNTITSNALCANSIKLIISSKFDSNVKFFCPRVSNLTTSFSGPTSTNNNLSGTLQNGESEQTEPLDLSTGVFQDGEPEQVEPLDLSNKEFVSNDIKIVKNELTLLNQLMEVDDDDEHMSCEDECDDEDYIMDYEEHFEEMSIDDEEQEDITEEYDENDVDECGIFQDEEQVVENGNTAAQPTVTTSTDVIKLDGFGVMPSPKDCCRRFDDYFIFKGKIASDTDGTVRTFVIPISPIPTKTISPGIDGYQISSPNMFQTMSLTHAYFGGSIDVNVGIVGCPNGTATVKYINGVPMFAYTNTTTPLRAAFEKYDWKILDLKSPTSVPAYVDQMIRDYTGMRAKEKRSLEMNNQITLGLPNHNEFSAISCIPIEIESRTIPPDSSDNALFHQDVRPTILGTLLVTIEAPLGSNVDGVLTVDMRAADSAHWSWPLGPPLCGTSVGVTQNVIYCLNLLETPYRVYDNGKLIYANANASLQYFSRPVGGAVGVKMYPLVASQVAALNKKRLLESGDVETNPGPTMSTLGSGDLFTVSSTTDVLKKWLNLTKRKVYGTCNSFSKVPGVIDEMSETLPAVRNAAENIEATSSKIGVTADTVNGILEFVRLKLARIFDLPVTSMLTILHYIQLMVTAKHTMTTISCFAGILFHLGLISFDAIAKLSGKIMDIIKGGLQDDDKPSFGLRYFNIIFSFILAGVGLVFTPFKKIPNELLNKTTAIFRNINCIDTFMRNNFDLIKAGTTWCTAKTQQCQLMLMNLGTLKPEIEEWLLSANSVNAPEFAEDIDTNVKKQKKLVDCTKEGTILYAKLVKMRTQSEEKTLTSIYNIVEKMLQKVRATYIKHAGKILLADRYSVPFCVWIYGEPGIGKSFIVPKLAFSFLKEMNIPYEGDPLYRRTVGGKFWDGLYKQLMLWLSDPEQDNSSEGITKLTRDWYEVFSPIPFLPEKADCSDKGQVHKFLGAFVDSNSFYSDKRRLVLSDEAFKSRRDVVAKITICKEFLEHLKKLGCEGRSKIEDYIKIAEENPEHEYPGFKEMSHLRVSYSFDGNVEPNESVSVSFAEFTTILNEKLRRIVTTRRVLSKDKTNMFEELSAENTAKRIAAMSQEQAATVIDTINAITGNDVAEDVASKVSEIQKNEEIVEETNETPEKEGELNDEEYDVDVKDVFYECAGILEDSVECDCMHKFLCKYGHEDLNLGVLNNELVLNFPADCLRIVVEDDFRCLLDNGTYCTFKKNACNCSGVMRASCYDWCKDKIDPLFKEDIKKILDVKSVRILNVEPSTILVRIFDFLVAVTVAASIIYLLVFIFRKIFGKGKNQDYERQMKTPKAKTPGSKVLQLNNPKFQDMEDSIMKGCGRFTCTFKVDGVLKEKSTNMYGLGGTAWYIPGHTVKALKEAEPVACTFVYKTHAGSPVVFTVPWSDCTAKYLFTTEHDIGVITHPRLQPVRSKINLFASAQELSQISSELCIYEWNKGVYRKVNVTNARVQIAAPEGHQQQLLTYRGFQGSGLCASPVVDVVSGKIVGFHNAGWPNGVGGATIVGKALMQKLIESCEPLFTDVHDIETEVVDNEMQNDYCIVEKILDPTFRGRISTKSSLQPSALYGVLGEPSKVIPQGSLQDAFECMKPYSKEPKYLMLPESIVNGAVEEYKEVILKEAPPVSAFAPKPLPVKTALEGIRNLPFHLPPMRDTSSGIPLLNLGLPKKGQCFTEVIDQEGRKITSFNPVFVDQYNEFTRELLSGCKPRSNAMLFLKDERKKPEKAIRGINGSDFVTHVLFLQYFLPFFAAYRQAKYRVGSAIGSNIDAESFDMFKYMGEVEEEVPFNKARYITADYKNFGPTIIHHVAGKMIDIIIAWYEKYGDVTPQDVKMMRRLFALMINSDHIVLDYWFRPQQGIFSGNPFTAEFNTFVNNLYIRCAWLYLAETDERLARISKGNPFYYFRKLVRIVTYGDDLVARTHSSLYPIFNNVTIKSFMDLIGLEFTDALKRPTMVETDAFEDVSFLKRTFKLHPKRYDCLLAALDMGTIRDMICYVRGRGEIEQKSVVIAKDAVRFSHGHGPVVFNEVRNKVISYCSNSESTILNNSTDFMSWDQYDVQIFDVQDEFVRSLLEV
ncbi:polyprotein [Picornaviridae sp.]|nr:polyprotein [Picornaviridae sp.]